MTERGLPQRWQDARGLKETREVLREAAHRLIRERGLNELNMRGLAACVGASAMAAYRYYPCKEMLVEDVRAHVRRDFARWLEDAGSAADPVERFHDLCLAYLDFALTREQDYRLMFGAASPPAGGDGGKGRASVPAWEVLLEALHRLPRAGGDPDVVDKAHFVWSTLHGAAMLHLAGRLGFGRSVAQLGGPLADLLLTAVTGAPVLKGAASAAA